MFPSQLTSSKVIPNSFTMLFEIGPNQGHDIAATTFRKTKPVKPAKRRLYSLNGMPADPERTATWAVDGAIALSLEREPISVEASRDVS
jgi:hypothetical protein